MRIKTAVGLAFIIIVSALLFTACGMLPKTAGDKKTLETSSLPAVAEEKATDERVPKPKAEATVTPKPDIKNILSEKLEPIPPNTPWNQELKIYTAEGAPIEIDPLNNLPKPIPTESALLQSALPEINPSKLTSDEIDPAEYIQMLSPYGEWYCVSYFLEGSEFLANDDEYGVESSIAFYGNGEGHYSLYDNYFDIQENDMSGITWEVATDYEALPYYVKFQIHDEGFMLDNGSYASWWFEVKVDDGKIMYGVLDADRLNLYYMLAGSSGSNATELPLAISDNFYPPSCIMYIYEMDDGA